MKMRYDVLLTVTSLLSVLLFSIHVTDDIIRGMSNGGRENITVILIMVVYLCGILLVPERLLGKVIILLGGLASASMPILHMKSASYGSRVANSSGGFLFVWTVLAIGTTGTISAILAVQALIKGKMAAVENENPDRRR